MSGENTGGRKAPRRRKDARRLRTWAKNNGVKSKQERMLKNHPLRKV